MKALFALLICFFGVSIALAASPSYEAAEGQYKELLKNQNFEELDRLEKEYLQKNPLMSDGLPLLAAYYNGLGTPLVSNPGVGDWATHYQLIVVWKKAFPESTAAKLAEVNHYIAYAWYVRGHNYVDKTTKLALEGFEENLNTAAEKLFAIPPAKRNSPDWYHNAIEIGLGTGLPKEQFWEIYDVATTKWPYYTSLYFAAANFLLPQWHGSEEEVADLVENAIEKTKSKWGDRLYARIYWSIGRPTMFSSGEVDWGRFKNAFEEILASHPSAWNYNAYGNYACDAEDWIALKKAESTIQGKPIAKAWRGFPGKYQICINRLNSAQKTSTAQ